MLLFRPPPSPIGVLLSIIVIPTVLSAGVVSSKTLSNCPTTQCRCESNTLSASSSVTSVINCHNLDLTSVPTFSTSPSSSSSTVYDELTLTQNRISSIKADAFVNVRVVAIDLSDNPLSAIDPLAFVGLDPSLRRLDLSLANDAQFPTAALSVLAQLTTLRIHGFSSTSLPAHALESLSALTELELIDGKLMRVDADDFGGQRNSLRRLSLARNSLTSVPSAALKNLGRLTEVDLSANRIRQVEAYAFVAGLTHVDLSNNALEDAVDSRAFVEVGDSLSRLVMQHCQLTSKSIESMRVLRVVRDLQLAYNSITTLPDGLFDLMTELRSLDLDSNKFSQTVKATFSGVRSTLEVLVLSNNPLSSSSISVSISPLSALRKLYLDAIDVLRLTPFTFSSPQRASLRLLSLRDTNIGDANLWPTLSTLTGLETLIASGCGLITIPDFAFRRSSGLQTLDLSRNSLGPTLTSNQLSGLSPTSLRSLSLDFNLISVVDWCALAGFPTEFLFRLGLSVNPLRCSDCSLVSLLDRVSATDAQRVATLAWTCDDGSFFGGQTVVVPDTCVAAPAWNCSEVVKPPDVGNETISDDELLTLKAHNETNECLLQWTLHDDIASSTIQITGFTLTFDPVIISTTSSNSALPSSQSDSESVHTAPLTATKDLPSDAREFCFPSPGLLSNTGIFVVCLTARIEHPSIDRSTPVCTTVLISSLEAPPIVDVGHSLPLIIGLGSSLGVLFVVLVVLAISFWNTRRRRSNLYPTMPAVAPQQLQLSTVLANDNLARSASGVTNNGGGGTLSRDQPDLPLFAFTSKRYVKTAMAQQQQSAGSNLFQTESERIILSPEQRERILRMLIAATDAQTRSETGRRRSTGSPEVLLPLPNGLLGFNDAASFKNGPPGGVSAPELHVYDFINDDDDDDDDDDDGTGGTANQSSVIESSSAANVPVYAYPVKKSGQK